MPPAVWAGGRSIGRVPPITHGLRFTLAATRRPRTVMEAQPFGQQVTFLNCSDLTATAGLHSQCRHCRFAATPSPLQAFQP